MTSTSSPLDLKELGNAAFKAGKHQDAISLYSTAILKLPNVNKKSPESTRELLATLRCNRAACELKLLDYNACIEDCTLALEMQPRLHKAIYRRAVAFFEGKNDTQQAHKDLAQLLHMDPSNTQGIALMRKVKEALQSERSESSAVKTLLQQLTVATTSTVTVTSTDSNQIRNVLSSLIGLCFEERYHALDLLRRGGLNMVCDIINAELTAGKSDSSDMLLHAVRVISAASTHKEFNRAIVDILIPKNSSSIKENDSISNALNTTPRLELTTTVTNGGGAVQLKFSSVCSLLRIAKGRIVAPIIVLIMNILKSFPVSITEQAQAAIKRLELQKQQNEAGSGDLLQLTREQLLTAATETSGPYTLSETSARQLLQSLCTALQNNSAESFAPISDALGALLSESTDFFEPEGREVDARLEGLEDRKLRIAVRDIISIRSRSHCLWAIDCGVLDQLIHSIDHEHLTIRINAASCLGKLVNYFYNSCPPPQRVKKPQQQQLQQQQQPQQEEEEEIEHEMSIAFKRRLLPYLPGFENIEDLSESKRVVELADSGSDSSVSIAAVRLRAALEASLLLANPELGIWALEQPGGVNQLHLLVATCEPRCQEIAAEVICLASAAESGAVLLRSIVSSGTLNQLMAAPHPGTRAAAASTVTKLSLKAKALTEDSAEIAHIMNASLSVLKAANNSHAQLTTAAAAKAAVSHSSEVSAAKNLVSFSQLDQVSSSRERVKKYNEEEAEQLRKMTPVTVSSSALENSNGITMSAVERAIEALAAMVGKSYIKEEIVHGSYRVAACISELTKLDVDARSTAAYGIAHILCALTVTNYELRAIALAEKDITPEQYQQMQELQRIKTKDEDGIPIEEKKEEDDPDTDDLCKRRIQKIIQCDAIKFLVKYLGDGSAQTKAAAARALRQICVEQTARGVMVQQGGFRACCKLALEDDVKKSTAMEAAHAVAKCLVTTNPHMLTEHQRLGAMKPLLMLCRDSDTSNLQQFEALLALTNLLSMGRAEHEKFVAEKGVHVVHYLIFSDHLMVRRAATEALCNIPSHESVLKLLRSAEKVKLWLGLCEEYNREDNPEEAMKTASAAAGTLAVACSDVAVAVAVVEADCAQSIVCLLESEQPPLVHRALVMLVSLLTATNSSDNGDDNSEVVTRAAAEELVDDRQRAAAMHLVTGGIVQAIGVVLKLQIPHLAELAKQAATLLSKATKNCSDPPSPPPATTASSTTATEEAVASASREQLEDNDCRVEGLEEIPHG